MVNPNALPSFLNVTFAIFLTVFSSGLAPAGGYHDAQDTYRLAPMCLATQVLEPHVVPWFASNIVLLPMYPYNLVRPCAHVPMKPVHMYTHTHTHIHTHTHTHTYTITHTHSHIHTHTCTTHTYNTHIHTYYTHTYTHMYTRTVHVNTQSVFLVTCYWPEYP